MIVYNEKRLKKTETEEKEDQGACEYENSKIQKLKKGEYTSSSGFIYVCFSNGSGCDFGEQPCG